MLCKGPLGPFACTVGALWPLLLHALDAEYAELVTYCMDCMMIPAIDMLVAVTLTMDQRASSVHHGSSQGSWSAQVIRGHGPLYY